MTVENYVNYTTGLPYELVCEECQSTEFHETEDGWACACCGLVAHTPRMEYHRPYESSRLQHSSIHNTTMGTSAERNRNQRSKYMNRLSKIHKSQTQGDDATLNRKTQNEIKLILSNLDLPSSFLDPIFKRFKHFYRKQKKGTRFRAPRMIIPVIIFYYCRENNIPLNIKSFLEVCKTNSDDFRRGRITYLKVFPEYSSRDRIPLIKNFISKIKYTLNLDKDFYENALHIAQYFWKYLYHTTDTVIAGFVSSLAVLCDYEMYREQVTINEICKVVNIRASTVNSRIINTVVKQLHIKGFESPVKSHDLLKTYIHKFEILPCGKTMENETKVEIKRREELVEPSWVGFEDALGEVKVELSRYFESIPLHILRIEVPNQESQEPEFHIFRFPSTQKRQSKVFAVQLTPLFQGNKKSQERFVFVAQKGPPWKDMPLIHPG